jgi:hypothetical protein
MISNSYCTREYVCGGYTVLTFAERRTLNLFVTLSPLRHWYYADWGTIALLLAVSYVRSGCWFPVICR